MISLFLDTSSKLLTVILVNNNEVIYNKSIETKNDHTSYAVPMIDEALKINNLKTRDINKIYIVNGPGSFTGTRIGVTIGKTLAYSNEVGIIPVSSLKQYIFSKDNKDYYVSMIIDKNNRLYYGIYDKNYNDIVTDKYSTIDDFKSDIEKLDGNIIFISDKELDDFNVVNQELDIIELMNYYKDNEIDSFLLKPNYLKKIEAEEKND